MSGSTKEEPFPDPQERDSSFLEATQFYKAAQPTSEVESQQTNELPLYQQVAAPIAEVVYSGNKQAVEEMVDEKQHQTPEFESAKSKDLVKAETVKSVKSKKSEPAAVIPEGDSSQTDDDEDVGKLQKVGQGFVNLDQHLL